MNFTLYRVRSKRHELRFFVLNWLQRCNCGVEKHKVPMGLGFCFCAPAELIIKVKRTPSKLSTNLQREKLSQNILISPSLSFDDEAKVSNAVERRDKKSFYHSKYP